MTICEVSSPSLLPSLFLVLPPFSQAQDLREEDMQIISRLVESEQSSGGALRKVLVVGDVDQTVFSDVLTGRSIGHPMDLLSSWMPSVRVNTRRLDINYRCPHAHVAFNNLALPRNASMGDGPVKPSPDVTDRSARRLNKPYLFTYVQSSSTVQNYDAYRTACRIAEMVLVLLRTMDGLRLRDIAITSRWVGCGVEGEGGEGEVKGGGGGWGWACGSVCERVISAAFRIRQRK